MADEPMATPERAASYPKAFSFFRSYYDVGKMLSDAQRLELFDAMCAFVFEGTTPTFNNDAMLNMAWTLAEPNLSASVRKSQNGQKGGRPKTSKSNAKSKPKAKEKQTESDTPYPYPTPNPNHTPNPTPNPLHSYSTPTQRESGSYYNDTVLADEDYVF